MRGADPPGGELIVIEKDQRNPVEAFDGRIKDAMMSLDMAGTSED